MNRICFFVFGIASKEKKIDFTQTFICPGCGAYRGLNAFTTYTYFSFFFIPIFKWNKKYHLRSSCCGSLYTINNTIGKVVEKGRMAKINESDLQIVNANFNRLNYCDNCSYPIKREFDYCPKCGSMLWKGSI